jgi:hypothetical protein
MAVDRISLSAMMARCRNRSAGPAKRSDSGGGCMPKESPAQRKWTLEMTWEEVELVRAIRALKYGRVIAVIQDHHVVRLETVEQRSLSP